MGSAVSTDNYFVIIVGASGNLRRLVTQYDKLRRTEIISLVCEFAVVINVLVMRSEKGFELLLNEEIP